MQVRITTDHGRTVVKPSGRIDSISAHALRQSLLDAIAAHGGPYELDMSDVPYVTSAGLQALVIAANAAAARGHKLTLTHVNNTVMALLNLVDFSSILDVQRHTE